MSGDRIAESVERTTLQRVISMTMLALAAAIACVLLWFPSAFAGVAWSEILGWKPYLTARGLAIYAVPSLALLVIPVVMIAAAGGWRFRTKHVIGVGATVIFWQLTWAAISLLAGNDSLIAWPSYAEPAEPMPWDPSAVFAVGLTTVALCVAGAMLVFWLLQGQYRSSVSRRLQT